MTTPKTKMPKASANQLAVPVGVVLIVVMMVVPIPTILLDLLIAMNITFAVLVVLVSMYVSRPLEFSSFPSLLLIATLFRLALNISATRLVLTDGFAGNVINSFGHFVIGGSLVVGLVIFAILLVIQFVVINSGAARVAEVGARFTLDAMPGKQMAIDADLNSGQINDKQARIRRREIAAEADFYGSMDGASRFVKGDAIAALLITFINLIGGFAIGVFSKGMSFSDALSSYSLMSVGDGLVSQIPALLLSVSTGLIVTRASDSDDMSTVVTRQLGSQLKALQIAGAAAIGLCIVPGLPKLPFLIVGAGILIIAARVRANGPAATEETEEEAATIAAASAVADTPESLLSEIMVEPLELMLSPDLISLVDGAGADLLDRVRALRRSLAQELGVVMPPVRTRDSLDLPHATYAIRINGVEVAQGQAPTGTVLAIGDDLDGLPGQIGHEPVFGLEGKWVPVELRGQAELLGATVVDRSSVIITHLSEAVRRNASRLLGREEVALAAKSLKRSHPTVVEDLTPALLSLGEIQRVLHALLDEGIPIRDLVRIFEALSVSAKGGTEPDRLIEAARNALAPAIVAEHSVDGHLDVITFDPRLQQLLLEALRPGEGGPQLVLQADIAEMVVQTGRLRYTEAMSRARHPVLVCAPQLRLPLRRLMRMTAPEMPILSYTDISAGNARIDTVGVIEDVRNAVL